MQITNNLEQLNNLSEAERNEVLKILEQMSEGGKSKAYNDLLLSDYEEIPVDIDTFLRDPKYLGSGLVNEEGKFTVYRYWVETLHKIFPDPLRPAAYNTLALTGAIGLGKSFMAVLIGLYELYRMMCLKDPYIYYGLQPIDKITFAFMNITLDASKGVAWDKMQQLLQSSPWFMERGIIKGTSNQEWHPPKGIELIAGSLSRHIIGRAVFFCLDGDTEIATTEGNFKIKDLEDKQIKVYTSDDNFKIVESDYCTVKQTAESLVEYRIELSDRTTIKCTPNHRFRLMDGSYKEAQKLELRDKILVYDSYIYISNIDKVIFSDYKKYYDVINADPYNNFLIKTNSGYICSHNCFMDEVSFQNNQSVAAQVEKAKTLVNTASARMQSRFMKNDVNPTIMVLASSKRTEQSYMETFIAGKKRTESKTTYVVDEPQWVIREDKNSDKKFKVAVGNKFLNSEVLPLDADEKIEKIYRDRGYSILEVPIGYYETFIDDIDIALTDVAGMSTSSSSRYISGPRLLAVKKEELKNPFIREVIEVGNAPEDTAQYYDFFDMDNVDPKMMEYPLYIHLDMSKTGDKTGIAGVWIKGKKPPVEGQPPSKELFYRLAFSVSIKAPKGYEISFEKNRQFIYWLKENNFKIKGISCFSGDTLIATPQGNRRIDSIKEGDVVFSFDDSKHEVVEGVVYNSINNGPRSKFIKIWVSENDFIECTPEHLIKTQRGYVMAKDLLDTDLIEIDDKIFYKNRLLNTGYFEDNEFLDKYINLIVKNRSESHNGYYEKHHIIPKSVFKLLKQSLDDSDINKCNLSYSDHMLAHCYLVKCSIEPYKSKAISAITMMMSHTRLLNTVDYNEYINSTSLQELVSECKSGKIHTSEEIEKIRESNRKPHNVHPSTEFKKGDKPWNDGIPWSSLYTEEERKEKFSKNGIYVWITDGLDETQILEEEKLPTGWKYGRAPFADDTCKKISATLKKKGIKPPVQEGFVNYTNGVETIRIFPGDEIPDGYYRGRTFNTETSKKKAFIYSDKFLSIDRDEYEEFFMLHSRKETLEFFDISVANHNSLCRFYGIVKPKR